MRHQENFGEAHLRAAAGVVVQKPRLGKATTPAAPLRRLRGIFLLSQPRLLTRRGIGGVKIYVFFHSNRFSCAYVLA